MNGEGLQCLPNDQKGNKNEYYREEEIYKEESLEAKNLCKVISRALKNVQYHSKKLTRK